MRVIKILSILLFAIALASCGGGDCAAEVIFGEVVKCQSQNKDIEEFTAAASRGELVKYKIDKTAMTYSYQIVASSYGLADRSKTGKIIYNPDDDTYTPDGLGSKIAINSDGLFYGVIKEDFGAGETIVPVFGIKNIEKSASKYSGTYNYVSYQCIGSVSCRSYFGTIRIDLYGYWTLCVYGNLSNESLPCFFQTNGFGSLDQNSNSISLIDLNGNRIGTAIAYVKNHQKIFIVDLNGGAPLIGKGMIVASSQSDVPTTMDGIWRYIRTSETGRLVIDGTTINQAIDGGGSQSTAFTPNQPWPGFATTDNGTIALAAGSGMYAAKILNGDFSVGLKK